MATIKIVPTKDWEILKKYLYADNYGAVVLVPEENLQNFSDEQAETLRSNDNGDTFYGFGGEPDIAIDVMKSPGTFCADEILSELTNKN